MQGGMQGVVRVSLEGRQGALGGAVRGALCSSQARSVAVWCHPLGATPRYLPSRWCGHPPASAHSGTRTACTLTACIRRPFTLTACTCVPAARRTLLRSWGYFRNRNRNQCQGSTGEVGREGEGEGVWACTVRSHLLLLRGEGGRRGQVPQVRGRTQVLMAVGHGDGIWGCRAGRVREGRS